MAVTLTEEEKRRLQEDDYQNGMDGTDIPPEATPSSGETQQPAGETQQRGLTRWEQTMASMNERANQLRANELARTNAWHQQLADARERRISGNRAIAAADPGRFSSFETNALRGIQHTRNGDVPFQDINERNGLRQHELDMLTRQGENEMGVAREKSYGMVHQGEIAAGISAGVNRELGRAQHGYFDENGNYVPGSSVRTAEATGLSRAEIARLNNEGRLDVANANNETRRSIAEGNNQTRTQIAGQNNQTRTQIAGQNNQTRKEVGAGHDQARRDAAGMQQQRSDQNARNRIVQDIEKGAYLMSGMSPEKWKSLSPEEQQAYINGLMPNQPNNNNNPQPPARRSWRDRYRTANK